MRCSPAPGRPPSASAGEVNDGVLALRTPEPPDEPARPIEVLAGLRAELAAFTPLIGAGVHPLGRFGDVRLRESGRALRN